MMKKRIAIIFYDFEAGGAQRVFLNLIPFFVEKNYRVDVVYFKDQGNLKEPVQEAGAHLVRLRSGAFPFSPFPLAGYFRKAMPAGVLSGMPHLNLISIWATMLSGARHRLVISEHTHISALAKDATKWWHKLYPHLLPRYYVKADRIVCVSRDVKNDLSSLTGLPDSFFKVIYNPVVNHQIYLLADRKPEQNLFDFSIPTILGVGRLEPEKDFATLIRAFQRLRESKKLQLLLLGEGRERERLIDLVKREKVPDVHFLGYAPNPFYYMKRAKVVAVPSRREGFGNVLVEAMALGIPVVSTNCPGGPAEILMDGKFGPLVPIGDADALARAIDKILVSPPASEQLMARAGEFKVTESAKHYLEELDPHFSS